MSSSLSARGAVMLALAGVLGLAACADHPTGPRQDAAAPVHFSASVTGTSVSTLTVEVTASDISTAMFFNFERQADGTAGGTIHIPAGSARTIAVFAFDSEGLMTHQGRVTVDVRPAGNPPVTIVLVPIAGQQPISVVMSSLMITVTPSTATLFKGEVVQLSAAITSADGQPVSGTVSWATSNPGFATVDASGLVTAKAEGSVVIMATYAGVGGSSAVTVQAGDFASLAVGGLHTCALDRAGFAYCWGNNATGQLGQGNLVNALAPSPVLGLGGTSRLAFNAIAAGLSHTCAIEGFDRQAYCWGSNATGQLGNSGEDASMPVAVGGTLAFTMVSAGLAQPSEAHTCAIGSDGKGYCWGSGFWGQLGNGFQVSVFGPAEVSTTATFAAVDAGGLHSCGVATDGALYCWGGNGTGQVGDGTTTTRLTPVAVAPTLRFTSVSAGFEHTCAIATTGATYCWGRNHVGQLGDGTTTARLEPTPVSTTLTFSAVSAGMDHTCALATSGAVHCWGRNASGQLGDGTLVSRSAPAAVASSRTFVSIGAGGDHSCALTTGGRAYCWGANASGQLGDGTSASSPTPVAVVKP